MQPASAISTLIARSVDYDKRVSLVQESPHHKDFPNGFSVSGHAAVGYYSVGGATIEEALSNAVAFTEKA